MRFKETGEITQEDVAVVLRQGRRRRPSPPSAVPPSMSGWRPATSRRRPLRYPTAAQSRLPGEDKSGRNNARPGVGGGIDCFIAAKLTGPSGRVIGIDMTEEMLTKALENR